MNQIGILTFCRYYNYGTALQAYALQHFVSQNFDCEAELVDYLERNEYVGKKLLLTRIKRFPTYIKNFKKIYIQRKNANNQAVKNRAFDEFFNTSMVLSKEKADTIEGLTDICGKYDAVMVGSDQTWNPFVASKGQFLLDYLDGDKIAKLAYAPSIGIGKIPEEYRERYKKALFQFKALSCRERGGAAFLSDLIGKKVEFVLDPTLLLHPEDWEEIATPVDIKEPYHLTYFLGYNKAHRKAAERIAREKNLKIVALPVSYLEIQNKNIDKQYVGPGGFISLIKNASFVCTDSFHGTMFSINFERDFASFPKRNDADVNSDNNRLYDALSVLGLEDRLWVGGSGNCSSVDYSEVSERLSKLRESSECYLNSAMALLEGK